MKILLIVIHCGWSTCSNNIQGIYDTKEACQVEVNNYGSTRAYCTDEDAYKRIFNKE